jgi:hypothetical protein
MNYCRGPIISAVLLTLGLPLLLGALEPAEEVRIKQDHYRTPQNSVALRQFDVIADWPTFQGVQQTGRIEASFNCFGQFGLNYSPYVSKVAGWPNSNFVVPAGNGPEYLYGGGLWVGGIINGDTAVSTGITGTTSGPELYPPGFTPRTPIGTVTQFDGPADYSFRSEFTDTINERVLYQVDFLGQPHIPLNLRMANRSHAWLDDTLADLVLYDLVITNVGHDFVHDAYVGVFFDADIGNTSILQRYLDDVAGSIRKQGIAYMVDADGDPVESELIDTLSATRIIAAKFLTTSFETTDTSFNWWESGLEGGPGGFGPRRKADYRDFGTGGTGAPQADVNRYYVMAGGEWDYDQVMAATIQEGDAVWIRPDPAVAERVKWGSDSRFLLSIGPFDLLPDSSVRVLYTTATADSIITRTDLPLFISLVPELYDDVLNLDELTDVLSSCDSLTARLLNPANPVSGLQVEFRDADSLVLEWDPWVFASVDGFDIFVREIEPSSFPYPGTIPPWLQADILQSHASVGPTYRHTLTDLDPDRCYLINIAHRFGAKIGDAGHSLALPPLRRPPAPQVESDFLFVTEDQPAELAWQVPQGVNIDHYNIYKFTDSAAASRRYHAFYDQGYNRQNHQPVDSFEINHTTYYYYAMEPFASLAPTVTSFVDPDRVNGFTYVVTYVDDRGFESDFSTAMKVESIPPRTRDILVLTHSTSETAANVTHDSLVSFYSDVLADFSYDIYDYRDTTQSSECVAAPHYCFDWKQLVPYRLVIVDDGMAELIMNGIYETATRGFERYLKSKGTLACFGSLTNLNGFGLSSPPAIYPGIHAFQRSFMGIDSLFYIGGGYYALSSTQPYVDSLSGFVTAEALVEDLPDLHFQSENTPLIGELSSLWPSGTAPSVAAFFPDEAATVLYSYRSLFPSSSPAEGLPVGILYEQASTRTCAFGFHLWYMDRGGARELVRWLLQSTATDVEQPDHDQLPRTFLLHQNYPNPFNPTTTIQFELPGRSQVTLDIFNILGRRVRRLVESELPAGVHRVTWNGRDASGSAVATGLYLYRITSEFGTASRKMLLLK